MSIMQKWFGGQDPSLVGLDISSSSVKLLELVKKGGRIEVAAFAIEPLPASAVVDQQVVEPEVVAEAIRKVLAKSGTKQRAAAVAVAGPTVITKVVQLSALLSEDDMEQQIRAEADQYIPFPIEDVSLDFQVLGPAGGRTEEVDVLLAACRRDQVLARTDALERAGLRAKVVDIQNHALELASSLLRHQMPADGVGQTIALVDIGAIATTLLFLHDHKLVYARESAFGGKQLTEDIMRAYGMSVDEALRAQRANALPESYREDVLKPFIDDIGQQVDRGLQFFFSAVSDIAQVDQIILAGGCAQIDGLAAQISERIGIPTVIARPFAQLSISPRAKPNLIVRDETALLLAAGLALRSFDDDEADH